MEYGCMFYNVGFLYEDGIYICELSDFDYNMNVEVFVSWDGFIYWMVEVIVIKICV